MKKYLFSIIILFFSYHYSHSEVKINPIKEGNDSANIKIIIYESLTCSHCASFHKNVYPNLKKDFIDKGTVIIEFRSFPLDLAALNASKIAHCKNDGNSNILHFLFENQKKWIKGNTIEDINADLKKLLEKTYNEINYNKCVNNESIENYILEDRIKGVKEFDINATPTLIINNKKFDNPLDYKKLKKTLEKLI